MEPTTHKVDGFTWEHVMNNDEGYKVFEIVGVPEDYPATEDMWVLAYACITVVNEAYMTSVGLAGHMGGEEFNQFFTHFEPAARFAIQVLEEHFFAEDGKFHGVDAIR